MVTESLLAVVGPKTFVVQKLSGEQLECGLLRQRGATVADAIWNLTSVDPALFNLIGTCVGGTCRLIPQNTSLDCINYALPLTLVPQLVGAAPKQKLAFSHPTSSPWTPGPSSKPLSAFFTPVTPAQAPAARRLTWVHKRTHTVQIARIGAPLLHDVRGKVTLIGEGLAEGTLCIEYIDKETEYVKREEIEEGTCKGGFATVKTTEADPGYVAGLAQPSRQIFVKAHPVFASMSLERGASETTVRLDLSTRAPDAAKQPAPKTPTNKGGRPKGSKDSLPRKKRYDAGRKKLFSWTYTGSEAQAHGKYMAKYGDALQHDSLMRVTFLEKLESGNFHVALRLEADGVVGSTGSPFGSGSAELDPKECRAGFDGPNFVPSKRAGKEQPAPYVNQAEIEAAIGEQLALPWDEEVGCATPAAMDDFLSEHPEIRSRLQWTDRAVAAELSGAHLAVDRAWLMYEKPKKGRPKGSKNKPKEGSVLLRRATKAQATAAERQKRREERALARGKVLKPQRSEKRPTWTETQRLQGVTLYDNLFAHIPNEG